MTARAALLLVLVLTAAGCSSSADEPDPVARPTLTCPVDGTSDIPAECVPSDKGFDVSAAPVATAGAPASSADIPAVVLPKQDRDLVLGGNDEDAALAKRTFEVTIPAGSRLRAAVACRGFAELDLTTDPKTKVELTLPCGQEGPIDLTVLDPTLVSVATTYEVTVRSAAPSRWYVALGSETRPAPAE